MSPERSKRRSGPQPTLSPASYQSKAGLTCEPNIVTNRAEAEASALSVFQRVTSLRPTGHGKRVSVHLDGRFAFSLAAQLALGLEEGQELSEAQVVSLTGADGLRRCLDTAYRYLSYRLRSEAELRERLLGRGFTVGDVAQVLDRLKEQRLVDDLAFARFWRENREAFRPRSQRLTRLELRRKGIDREIIAEVTSDIDDSASAYRAATVRASRLSGADRATFHRRLGEYLRRRGYGYEVTSRTVDKLWREKEGSIDANST